VDLHIKKENSMTAIALDINEVSDELYNLLVDECRKQYGEGYHYNQFSIIATRERIAMFDEKEINQWHGRTTQINTRRLDK
jgi:hypothetical protein